MWEQSRLFCMTCYGSGWSKVCAYHHPENPDYRLHDQNRRGRCICVPCKNCDRLTADGVDTRWLPV